MQSWNVGWHSCGGCNSAGSRQHIDRSHCCLEVQTTATETARHQLQLRLSLQLQARNIEDSSRRETADNND